MEFSQLIIKTCRSIKTRKILYAAMALRLSTTNLRIFLLHIKYAIYIFLTDKKRKSYKLINLITYILQQIS